MLFQLNDKVRINDECFPSLHGQAGTITEIDTDDDCCPYSVTLSSGLEIWCCGGGQDGHGLQDLELVHREKAPIRNSLEELKAIMDRSSQRENLLYQWVREDRISFKQFLALLEYKDKLAKAAREFDEDW